MGYEYNSSPEQEELKSPEANALDFLIATFTGRIAAVEHMEGRDHQPAVDKWIAENAHKFNDAFDEMRKERPDLIDDTSYAKQEESIKYIEEKLR